MTDVLLSEKFLKRAVSRSQSPHAFGTALSSAEPEVNVPVRPGRRRSFDELQDVQCHVSYHAHSDEGLPIACIVDAVKGCALGFGAWVVPVSIMYRRVTGLRRGIALGLFFGSFRVVSCSLFRVLATVKTGRQGTDIVRRFVNAVAGFVSGAIFSSVDQDVRQAVIVLWIVIRALRALLPPVPFSDVIIMMFSASNILATYVHAPTDHAKSYQGFLHKFGGKTSTQLAPFRTPSGDGPEVICELVHPGQGCMAHMVTFTVEGLLRAVPLYLPVHLAGLLLSSHKSVPLLASNVLRSALFLSVYCSSAWYAACQYYRYLPLGPSTRFKTLFVEWIPGLAVLLERPSRRKELASYCLSHALNSYWTWAKRGFGFKSRSWVSVLLL